MRAWFRRWRRWYREARRLGHTRRYAVRWALRIAWVLR
jgi:hypothetical protein